MMRFGGYYGSDMVQWRYDILGFLFCSPLDAVIDQEVYSQVMALFGFVDNEIGIHSFIHSNMLL